MKTSLVKLLSILGSVFVVLSCEKEINIPVTGVNLSDNSMVIEVDSAVPTLFTIEPQDATNKTLIWSSSDTTIARVSSEGIVTGVSSGTTNILIESKDGYSDILKVHVVELASFDIPKEVVVANKLAMAFDNYGNLWYGEAKGLYKMGLDGFGSRFHPLTPQVRAIAFDSENNLWAATFSDGLLKFDGQTWFRFDTANSEIPSNDITTVAVDSNNTIWFGISDGTIQGGGLASFDGTNWKTHHSEDGLTDSRVIKILVDQQNSIWFSTEKGVSMFNGAIWKSYLNDDAFNPTIIDMEADNENNIWFVSLYDGIFKYDGSNMINYRTSNSSIYSDRIQSVGIDDEGNEWFGHTDGVSKFSGTEWIHLTSRNFNVFDIRDIVIDSEGNKWFASPNKIYKLVD